MTVTEGNPTGYVPPVGQPNYGAAYILWGIGIVGAIVVGWFILKKKGK